MLLQQGIKTTFHWRHYWSAHARLKQEASNTRQVFSGQVTLRAKKTSCCGLKSHVRHAWTKHQQSLHARRAWYKVKNVGHGKNRSGSKVKNKQKENSRYGRVYSKLRSMKTSWNYRHGYFIRKISENDSFFFRKRRFRHRDRRQWGSDIILTGLKDYEAHICSSASSSSSSCCFFLAAEKQQQLLDIDTDKPMQTHGAGPMQ